MNFWDYSLYSALWCTLSSFVIIPAITSLYAVEENYENRNNEKYEMYDTSFFSGLKEMVCDLGTVWIFLAWLSMVLVPVINIALNVMLIVFAIYYALLYAYRKNSLGWTRKFFTYEMWKCKDK